MILNGVNSDDYVYFKVVDESSLPFDMSHLKKDTVLRFKLEDLRTTLWRRSVLQNLDYFKLVPNPEASKYDFLPSKLYSRIIVKEDIDLELDMDAKDILLIDKWLWRKLNSSEVPELNSGNALSFLFGCESSKSPLERNRRHLQHTRMIRYDGTEHVGCDIFQPISNFDDALSLSSNFAIGNLALPARSMTCSLKTDASPESEKIIDAYQFGNSEVIIVPLRKGEEISFNSSVVNLLFLDQEWIKLLLGMSHVSEKEHLEFFEREFSGYIPEANRRYFKINDYLKLHSLRDITESEIFQAIREREPSFQNIFYHDHWRYSGVDDFDFDSDGYLRYVWCRDELLVEHELSKIADRVSYEEGKEHFEHEVRATELLEKRKELEKRAREYFKNNQGKFYKLLRKNPNLTYVEFMLQEEDRTKKVLVKRLINTINGRIVKE